MKAFIMDENRELKIAEVPEPYAKEDNMIVRVRSASICGTDMRTFLKGNAKITPPRVLGHEFAGDVIHAGNLAKEYGFSGGRPGNGGAGDWMRRVLAMQERAYEYVRSPGDNRIPV